MKVHAHLGLMSGTPFTISMKIEPTWSAAKALTICSRAGCQGQSRLVKRPSKSATAPTNQSGPSIPNVAPTIGKRPRVRRRRQRRHLHQRQHHHHRQGHHPHRQRLRHVLRLCRRHAGRTSGSSRSAWTVAGSIMLRSSRVAPMASQT